MPDPVQGLTFKWPHPRPIDRPDTGEFPPLSEGLFGDERFVLLFSREQYIQRLKLVAKSPFGRQKDPQRTQNSFFAGFFMKPRRVPYQDLPKAGKNGERRGVWEEDRDLILTQYESIQSWPAMDTNPS